MKKFISIFLAITMLFSVSGCAKETVQPAKSLDLMPVENPNVYTFDRFGDEVMPIGGYIGPTPGFGWKGNYYPSQITDYHFNQVSDCGLNFIVGMKPNYKQQSEDVINSLYYADKNDVMYFVCDTGLFQVTETNAANPDNYTYLSLDDFKERVEIYKNYNSFAGLVCRDEPWANMFDQCKEILYYFNETFDDNKLLYLNSHSMQCPKGWFGGGSSSTDAEERSMTLDDYMDKWFESFPTLGYYSYDTYPFLTEGTDYIRPYMFLNYELVRRKSTEAGVPFWTFMQVGGRWSGSSEWRYINEGEMLWQVNTALAFGAKGYTYYSYNTPPEQVNSAEGDEGLVGRGGQKNENWYFAQKANRQIKACDHILMKSEFKGMIHVLSGKKDSTNSILFAGTDNEGINRDYTDVLIDEFREVKSITGDNSITGCFNYQGRTMLYVVNNSITRDKAKVTIKFDDNRIYSVIQRAQERTGVSKELTLTFAPGEGACVVIG